MSFRTALAVKDTLSLVINTVQRIFHWACVCVPSIRLSVSHLHNGWAVSHSKSRNQTMCLKTRQLVPDATLKRTIQASMYLLIARVLQVCTYPAWRCSVDQSWRRHPHGWYCGTWRVALICGCILCSIETEVHCKQCNCIGLADVAVSPRVQKQVTSAITAICPD